MRAPTAGGIAVVGLFSVSLFAGVVAEDSVPLKDWSVPFEQIRAKVMETEPLRIAERSLHPSANSVPSAASHFITIVPCRVADTRLANGPYGGPKLVGGTSRTFNVPGGPCAGIPTTAAAYSLNFTVLNGEGSSGFLTAYPTGATKPTVSTLNYGIGNLVANAAIVPAGTSASIDVYVNYNVDFIMDINGYFVEGVVTNIATGTGLTGGGTGAVILDVAPNGVGASQLAANAVTTGAIQDNAVTAAKIATGQVVKSVKGLTDVVDIVGSGSATVSATGNTITIGASAPSNSFVLGFPGDTSLIGAGYSELYPTTFDAWRATSMTNVPSQRDHHSAVWTGTKMIVWGGWGPLSTGGYGPTNTGGIYDPATNTWTATTTTNAPTPVTEHRAVWSPETGLMIVWGGYAAGTINAVVNSGGKYNLATNTWTATNLTNAPAARSGYTAIWNGTYMIVWGGTSDGTLQAATLGDGGMYRPTQDDWLPIPSGMANEPSARYYHAAVWTGSQMVVWGGKDALTYFNTGGRYNPATNIWTPTSTTGAVPVPRSEPTAVWTGTRMIVWGGYFQASGGTYDPVADLWTSISTVNAPNITFGHSAVWTGQRMIVWGGYNTSFTLVNTGFQYDPVANAWVNPLAVADAPIGRRNFTAIWTNSNRLVVFGGNSNAAYLNSGGQWLFLSLFRKN